MVILWVLRIQMRNSFELESLEQRIYLSADVLPCTAPAPVGDDPNGSEIVIQVDSLLPQQSESNAVDFFAGLPADDLLGFELSSAPLIDDGSVAKTSLDYSSESKTRTDLLLRTNAEDSSILELSDRATGDVLAQKPIQDVVNVVIDGMDGVDDTLTIDFDGMENLDVVFNGGAGGFDSLIVQGGSFNSGDYTAEGRDSGTLKLANDSQNFTVRFSGLEPTTSLTAIENFVFRTLDYGGGRPGVDVIAFDSPSAGTTRISGTIGGTGFESLTFSNIKNFTLDTFSNDTTGNDADSVVVPNGALSAAGLTSLTIQTGSGDDRINVAPTPSVAINLSGGEGNDDLAIDAQGNACKFGLGRITVSGMQPVVYEAGVEHAHVTNVGLANPSLDTLFETSLANLAIDVSGNLNILGQAIEGSFTLSKADNKATISANISRLELTVGNKRLLELSGSGDFLVNNAGVAGAFTVNRIAGSEVAGLDISGKFELQVNTTNSPVSLGTVTLPSGPFVRIAAINASVTTPLGEIRADSFVMEKMGTGADSILRVTATGVSLVMKAGTSALTISDGSGAFIINSAGIAGSVGIHTVSLAGVPGVSMVAKDMAVRFNTTGKDVTPVSIPTASGIVTVGFTGAYEANFFRVAGTADLELDGFMRVSGSFAVEKGTLSDGTEVIKGAIVEGSGSLGSSAGQTSQAGVNITQVAGAFLFMPDGVAMDASGVGALVGFSGAQLAGAAAIRVNTTTRKINEEVETPVGKRSVVFSDVSLVQAIVGSLDLIIDGFATVSGSFSFENSVEGNSQKIVAGAVNASAFMGSGNTGVLVSNASFGLVLYPETAGYALKMTGNAAVNGFSQLSANGTLKVLVNTTNNTVNETISTSGGDVAIRFLDATPVKRIEGTLNLNIVGYASFAGDFSFTQTGTASGSKILAGASNVEAFMGAGSAGIRIRNAQFGLVLNPGSKDYALNAGGTASLEGVAGVTLTGTLVAQVNTTGTAVSETIKTSLGDVQVGFTAQQGNLIRFAGVDNTIAIGDTTLTGSFSITKTTLSGADALSIGASGVRVFMGANNQGVQIIGGSLGFLVLSNGSYALRTSGSANIVGFNDFAVEGAFALGINNTGSARLESVDTGALDRSGNPLKIDLNFTGNETLRISGSQVKLMIAGNSFLAGSIFLSRNGDQVDIAGNNLSFVLRAGSKRVVGIENADFAFTLASGGVTGAVLNTVVLGPDYGVNDIGVSNISLSGVVSLYLNTTTTARTLIVNGTSVDVPAAVAGGRYLDVEVVNPVMTFFGSTLTAEKFVLRQVGVDVSVTGSKLDFSLNAGGKRVAAIQDADFVFRFTQAGLAGAVKHGMFIGPDFGSDIVISGNVGLALNTTTSIMILNVAGESTIVPAAVSGGNYLRLEIANGGITVLGNSIQADSILLESKNSEVTVASDNIHFQLAAGSKRIVGIDSANLSMRFTQAGLAGAVTGGVVSGPDFGDSFSLSGTASLLVNTTASSATLNIGGGVVTLPSGPYVRVELASANLTILGNTLAAEKFVFEKATQTVSVSGSGLKLELGAGATRVVGVHNGSFAFQFYENGVAGAIVDAEILGPQFGDGTQISGVVTVLTNTTNADRTFTIAGKTVVTPASGGGVGYLRLDIASGRVDILGQHLRGNLSFEETADASGTVVKLKASAVQLGFGDGTNDFATASVANANFTFNSGGVVGSFNGNLSVNVPGITFTGLFSVDIDTSNQADRHIRASCTGLL